MKKIIFLLLTISLFVFYNCDSDDQNQKTINYVSFETTSYNFGVDIQIVYEIATSHLPINRNQILLIMKSEKYSVKPIIVMGTEKPVRVGEPTELTFFRSSYIATDSMKVKINGRPIAVKDGIAEFDYRPTSTGTKYFKMDISLKNPFTGKMDNFSRTQKIEVID